MIWISNWSILLTINVSKSPIMVIMSRSHIWRVALSWVSIVISLWDICFSDLGSVLEEHMDTVIVSKPMTHSISIWINLILEFIYPMIQWVLIALNGKDILIKASVLGANIHHWQSIGIQVNITRKFWECKAGSSRKEPNCCMPWN